MGANKSVADLATLSGINFEVPTVYQFPVYDASEPATEKLKKYDAAIMLDDITAALVETPQFNFNDNIIINGGFDVWQRGTSWAGLTNTTQYTADRWQYVHNSTGAVVTVSANTDRPEDESHRVSNYSLKVNVTTADVSIDSGVYSKLNYKVEGYDIIDYFPSTDYLTISFWVKSSKTGVYYISLQNNGIDRYCFNSYTVNSANTWEKKEVNLVLSTVMVGGTQNYENGVGMYVNFILACGSTYKSGSTGSICGLGNIIAGNDQVNFLDTIGNSFLITRVKLEPGMSATPFYGKKYVETLAMCQRYYEQSTDIYYTAPPLVCYGLSAGRVAIPFRVIKRETGCTMGGSVTYYSTSAWRTPSSTTITAIYDGFTIYVSGLSLIAPYAYPLDGSWTADAEL